MFPIAMKNKLLYTLSLLALGLSLSTCESAENLNISTGKAGSQARFNLMGDHLYLAQADSLQVVDISQPNDPQLGKKIALDTKSETIFGYNHLLYIGSPTGMEILSVSDPANPEHLGFASHILGCDPVVVQGDYAYLTVRGTSNCRRNSVDRLIVNNVEDPVTPYGVWEGEIANPYGLGTHDTLLYVCTGDSGLNVYSIFKPEYPRFLYNLNSLHAWDVIPDNNRLLVVGENGFYQYDFTNPAQPEFLSQLPQ